MKVLSFLYPALVAFIFTPNTALAAKQPKDAILLSKVKTLTLRSNAKTAHRRVPAVDQLVCKGPACRHYKVEVMRCTNAGSAYNEEDVEWSCTADMPDDFKLGSTDVQCEGYKNRDDPYVLKGSCGVEYRLLFTDKGEEKYGSGGFWSGKKSTNSEDDWGWDSILFALIFSAVAIWILVSMCAGAQQGADRRPPGARPGGYWGGGGGGGPGDPWDPPPPYPGKRYNGANEGWRPGFWSGVLGGAAAGYMAGNRGQRQPEPAPRNSWFGGGNSGGNSGGNWGNPTRSSGSSSSARHESTGFGSTSRR
ncbi:hypothetical protein BGZ60DRAFT_432735 [Tricladium varicosporioides]|nr:hypothetical protein BGZ60DRAFT_432735 [Hymenoscyphus varicosporioides]